MKIERITEQSELELAFKIRKKVFVEGQGVPQENEIDDYEDEAEHILVYSNDQPVGTGRLRVVEGIAKLERICVLPAHRKKGLGRVIMQELEEIAREKGITKVKLHSQTPVQEFYEKLGYQPASEVFMEEEIPHILMTKELS